MTDAALDIEKQAVSIIISYGRNNSIKRLCNWKNYHGIAIKATYLNLNHQKKFQSKYVQFSALHFVLFVAFSLLFPHKKLP